MSTPKLPGRPLTKSDLKKLASDWIDEPTAEAARLRRVNSTEGAEIVGRKDHGTYQGIVFPYVRPGEPHILQIRLRRDKPDIEYRGTEPKEVDKYLTAPGSLNMLYFPPVDPIQMTAANLPLVVTEGEKKTLALWRLASHEARSPRFLPLGLQGVANWRGRIGKVAAADGGRQDEKGPIPDWGRLSLTGREVYILFDRDATTNPRVRYQRYKLAGYLGGQGARVRIAEIPEEAEQKGVDELLAAHGPANTLALLEKAKAADIDAELAALNKAASSMDDKDIYYLLSRLLSNISTLDFAARRTSIRRQLGDRINITDLERMIQEHRKETKAWREKQRKASGGEELRYTGETYQATDDGLIMWRVGREGNHSPVTLANFTARIVADVVRDDGEEKTRALKLAASLNGQASELIITAAEFGKMDWPIDRLGARANVMPNYKDHTRCAIQTISTSIDSMTSYCHTGWNQIEGKAIYLHAGGAIWSGGHVPNLHIDLDRQLQKYRLPEPPVNGNRKAAVRSLLEMLNVAPYMITLPVLAAAIRAALGQVRCSVFLIGQTGSGKSEIAALAQQCYGAEMNAASLPGSWNSTANALEAIAHRAKDALLVVDDFVPKGGASDLARLNQTADRLLRAQGNASGRARMAADTTLKSPKVPRGLILSTGEDLPRGHSLRARLVILDMQPNDMQWSVLTKCQAAAADGQYAAAMAAYIQHLAADLPKHRRRVEEMTAAMREGLAGVEHKRTPDNLANLAGAFVSYLDFARDIEAITAREHNSLTETCAHTISVLAQEQGKAQEHGEPCAAFLESLVSAINSGAAHLADITGNVPQKTDQRSQWGWRRDPADNTIWRPMGTRIGWIDDDDVYLDAVSAYKVAQSQGLSESLQLGLSTLKRRMSQRGLLKSIDQARETTTVRRTLEGSRKDVLHLHATASLSPENNPTNPTRKGKGTKEPEEAGELVGFSGQVFKAISRSRR